MLLVASGSALATTGHTLVSDFGGLGNGNGQFGEPLANGPAGVAVMPSTGEVFTTDAAQGPSGSAPRVQRFSGAGAFSSGFPIDPAYPTLGGVAVDPGGLGAVYVSATRNDGVPAVLKYSTTGTFAYALDVAGSGTSIGGGALVAIDPIDGTVYVTATDSVGLPVIDSFDPATGAFVASFDGSSSPDGGFACPSGLAVDGSHRIYVLDTLCKGRVDQYSAAGVFGATIDDGSRPDGSRATLSAVAADPASDEVYVAKTGLVGLQVTHFNAGGAAPIYTFDASDVGGVRAMAVSGAGTLYTSDATDPLVERFVRFDGPTVVTGGVSSVQARSAVLEGTIDPEGATSSSHFEYGLDETYGSQTDESSPVSGGGATAASGTATDLSPNTLYHYRIVGSNDSGSIVGADQTFATATAPPVPDRKPASASAITPRSVRLHGTVNPSNSFAGWYFEYGTSTAYGSSGPSGFLGGGTDQAVFSDLSELEPDTTYHFRLVANDFVGGTPQTGADQTFSTAPAAGGGATDVTTRRATLTATINPRGAPTTYHFNYGPTPGYGASTPEVDGGSGNGDRPVIQHIAGLLPDTTYHVQVVATTGDAVHSGADGLFRTAPAPASTVLGPSGVSTNAATLSGDVNTYGLTGSYRFAVWSLDSSYASSTDVRSVSGSASTERVSVAMTGLPPGETLVVQLTVTSNDSTTVSDLLTFATVRTPEVFPSPPAGDVTRSYGCASPRLDAHDAKPKPGDTITITGHDLGVGGNVMLDDRPLTATGWSTAGFTVTVPDDARGTLALTVNCGHRSNTIAIAIFQEPDNTFSITRRSVTGRSAALTVKVPGPGKVETAAAKTTSAKATVKKAGTATIRIKLTTAGLSALNSARSHALKITARVRFTPAGGRPASKTVVLTFKRKAGR